MKPGARLDEGFYVLLLKSLVLVLIGIASCVAVVESAPDRLGIDAAIGNGSLPEIRSQAIALSMVGAGSLLAVAALSIRRAAQFPTVVAGATFHRGPATRTHGCNLRASSLGTGADRSGSV